MTDTPNYTAAFEELKTLVADMESGEISIDALSEKLKRATLLIKICNEKLTATEEDVHLILKELDNQICNFDEGLIRSIKSTNDNYANFRQNNISRERNLNTIFIVINLEKLIFLKTRKYVYEKSRRKLQR